MDKYIIVDLSFTNTIIDVNSLISAYMMSARAINDVLCMRDQKKHQLYVGWTESVTIFFLSWELIVSYSELYYLH